MHHAPEIQQAVHLLPEPLRDRVDRLLTDFFTQPVVMEEKHHHLWMSIPKVWAISDYVSKHCLQQPELMTELFASGALNQPFQTRDFSALLQAHVASADTQEAWMSALRCFRKKMMLRLIWRDIMRWSTLEQTLDELSSMADVIINACCSWIDQHLQSQYGCPEPHHSLPQRFVVLALGKLGGRELNLSSDIDLIFSYPSEGMTQGENSISHSQYFNAFSRLLIQMLHTHQDDGFVFRVDMRLRPFGEAGALSCHYAFMADYLQRYGRDWERYAYIKARVISGYGRLSHPLMHTISQFVFQREINFDVIQSLQKMHQLIKAETAKMTRVDNIKVGRGGIREIEFIVQIFQLIYGRHHIPLRDRRTLTSLHYLHQLNFLSADVCRQLRQAYCFLRDVEHKLQAVDDKQTHAIPTSSIDQARLAYAMDHLSWDTFSKTLDQHRDYVRHIFQLVTDSSHAYQPLNELMLASYPTEQPVPEQTIESHHQSVDPQLMELLQAFLKKHQSHLSDKHHMMIHKMFHRHLRQLMEYEQPHEVMQLALSCLDSSILHPKIIHQLYYHHASLRRLIRCCALCPKLIPLLVQTPKFIHLLWQHRGFAEGITAEDILLNLDKKLELHPHDDTTHTLDILLDFKQCKLLQTAISDLFYDLPITTVSAVLSYTAAAIIDKVHQLALAQISERPHPCSDLLIIAYGKLGSMEMGYHSDCDLVFVFDDTSTDVDDGIASLVFHTSLTQHLMHLMHQPTLGGKLYEIDTRLRPSGNSGPILCSLKAFKHYLEHEAWTWEHQALVKARAISGHDHLRCQFHAIREEILQQSRPLATLRQDIRDMREKMFSKKNLDSTLFDIKSSPGGILDIEFITQYYVLACSHQHPQLAQHADTLSILGCIEEGKLLPTDTITTLQKIYLMYRQRLHEHDLKKMPPTTEREVFAEAITCVLRTIEHIL